MTTVNCCVNHVKIQSFFGNLKIKISLSIISTSHHRKANYNTNIYSKLSFLKVFEETGKAMAYSEPEALNVATQLSGLTSEKDLDRIITHTVNILCRPLDNNTIELYLLKFQRPTISEMPRFLKLFPNYYNLFAYRGLQVAKSLGILDKLYLVYQSQYYRMVRK